MCQLKIKAEATLPLADAKRSGVVTILNPAPARQLASAFYSALTSWHPTRQAEILTGCNADTIDGAKSAACKLLEFGARCVVMTLGAKGVDCPGGSEVEWLVSAPEIASKVVDTSGAGDCF